MITANTDALQLKLIRTMRQNNPERQLNRAKESQMEYFIGDLDNRHKYFKAAIQRIDNNKLTLGQAKTIAKRYLDFRNEQLDTFLADKNSSAKLLKSSDRLYKDLETYLE